MITITEIRDFIKEQFDGTQKQFFYRHDFYQEISNPDESYLGTLNLNFSNYPDNDADTNIYVEESEAWDKFLEENQWKIYPLLANIMQVFLPTGNYQLFYTQYPQGFISIIAKPHDK